MKHLFAVILVLLIFMISCSVVCAEKSLALPDELMYTITHETDSDLVYEKILSHSEVSEYTESWTSDYSKERNLKSFSIENCILNGIEYRSIFGEYMPSSDSLPVYTVTLEYKCPFGEKPEDSEIFVNTVRYYDQKYRQIDIGPFARQMDEVGNSVSIHWRDDDTNARIMLEYHNGDVSKGFFPHIEICILRTSNQ